MKVPVLLIGGCGFIGTNLAIGYASRGYSVHIYDRYNPNDKRFRKYKDTITITIGNFSDTDNIKSIIDELHPELIIHLVSNTKTDNNLDKILEDINEDVRHTLRLLEAIREIPNLKFVYFSSGGTVYGNNGKAVNTERDHTYPVSTYGWSKLCIENLIRMYSYRFGIEYLILRPSNPYGPWQNIYGHQGLIAVTLGKILSKEEIVVWGDGLIVRDYIYISDLVDSTIAVCLHPITNETYNISSGSGYSVNDLIQLIMEVTGTNNDVIYKEGRKSDIDKNVLDNSKLSSTLDLFHFTPLSEGIAKTWQWINEFY